jgi:hypothetical protein
LTNPYGRAGSLFIHSLFDSHPNILTLPRCGMLYSFLPEITISSDLERQIDLFIKKCPGIFDTSKEYFGNFSGLVTGKFGINGDEELFLDSVEFKEKFLSMAKEELSENEHISRKDFFTLIHIAYGLCIRSFDLSQSKYIFYHPHSDDEWNLLIADFPDLYFIAMTRDPRQEWTSWKKIHALRMGRDTSSIPPISLFLTEYYYSNSCYILINLVEKLKTDHIRVIDLESFHVMNKVAISHLCNWLGIEFNEILLNSTFNGRRWYGNATNLAKTSSFNPQIKRAAWLDELSELEIDIINRLVPGSIRYLNYEVNIDEYFNGSFEMVHNDVKYDSKLLLAIHCFLNVSGNPLLVFPGIESNYPMAKRVGRGIRNILKMGRTVPVSIKLYRKLKGESLNSLLNTMASNERHLLNRKIPPQLFIEYYA